MERIERNARVSRQTNETDVVVSLGLDGHCEYRISTGVDFFDHMLEQFARHSGFSLTVEAEGDIGVDYHHTVEDVGIALGQAFDKALGKKDNIKRYGSALIPMDEALVESVIDFSGRIYLNFDAKFPTEKTGSFDLCLVEEFMRAFASNARASLHIMCRYGANSHHIAEAIFKSLAYSVRSAVELHGEGVVSTKGVLE